MTEKELTDPVVISEAIARGRAVMNQALSGAVVATGLFVLFS